MGLIRSLTSGSSSLKVHQQKFDVISNNLANSNTIGFKSSRATFVDQLNQTMRYGKSPDSTGGLGSGGMNPMQIGMGVKMGAIQNDMSQGIVETTNRPLDMAMNGDGYFVYNLNGREMFSRAGAVNRDQTGNLVDASSGAFLQGYNLSTDASGRPVKASNGTNILDRTISNLNIPPGILSQPRQTQVVKYSGNLDSQMADGETRSTSLKIFDNVGGARNLTLNFTKSPNPGEFDVAAELDGNAVTLPVSALQFNSDGTLDFPLSFNITAADLNSAIGGSVFDAGTPKDVTIQLADPRNLFSQSMTQFSAPSTATALTQDGYQAGELLGLEVDSQGKLWGSFTNGQSEILGQVVMAKFTNPEALAKEGGNFFTTTANSGLANLGTAGENFTSTRIVGRALEQSNVDITEQFTDLISTQRAFEAASRTITVSDQFLQETVNLKR